MCSKRYNCRRKLIMTKLYLNRKACGFFPILLGGTGTRVICSDCYDNANIYSRTREYCPYTYIAEEDVLDQTLSSLMVQMPKETFLSHPPQDAATLESLIPSTERELSAFPTNHERMTEKLPFSQMSSGNGCFCSFLNFWFHFHLICPSVLSVGHSFHRKQISILE